MMLRLSAFTTILYFSMAAISFYLPLYFQYQGLDAQEIGLIMGAGSIVTILAQPMWGLVSDRFKTIRNVLAVVILLGVLTSAPMFYSDTIVLILLATMLFMLFFSSWGPLTDSLLVKAAFEHNRSFGSIRLWGEVGVGAGALVIGLAIDRTGMGQLWAMFVIVVVFALLAMIRLPDAKPHAVPVSRESLRKLAATRPFLLYLVLMLFVAVPHRMNDVMMVLYLSELGASDSLSGIAWTVATMSAVPTLALIGYFIRKYNELKLVLVAVFFYAIRWFIYSLASSPLEIVMAQAFHLLTFPIVLVASVQFVFKIVPDELKSTGQALFTSVFFGIGGIIGNAGGGWMMQAFGAETMYQTGGWICVAGGLLLLASYRYLAASQEEAYRTSVGSTPM